MVTYDLTVHVDIIVDVYTKQRLHLCQSVREHAQMRLGAKVCAPCSRFNLCPHRASHNPPFPHNPHSKSHANPQRCPRQGMTEPSSRGGLASIHFRRVRCPGRWTHLCGLQEVHGRHVRDGLALHLQHQVQRHPMAAQVVHLQQRGHQVARVTVQHQHLPQSSRRRLAL